MSIEDKSIGAVKAVVRALRKVKQMGYVRRNQSGSRSADEGCMVRRVHGREKEALASEQCVRAIITTRFNNEIV